MIWLNWSLKLHSGLRTIPHLIFTHNTQNFVQIMLTSFVWLYMFKGDVYAQVLVDQTQKYFWVFYMFLKVILYFRAFSFCSKCIFVFFFKNWFRGCFVRSSRLRASCKKCLREMIFWQFTQKLSQLSHDYIATVSRLYRNQQLLAKCCLAKIGFFQIQTEAITTVSRFKASRESFYASEVSLTITSWLRHYCLTREKRVFSVLYSRCDSFSNT